VALGQQQPVIPGVFQQPMLVLTIRSGKFVVVTGPFVVLNSRSRDFVMA